MAIKKFENKGLKPDQKMTEDKKSAIIETKEVHCYPQYGKTIIAKNKAEADKEIKKITK